MIPLRAVIVAIALATAASARADTHFLAAFEDVPLAPGLVERADASFAFDGPDGRIADATAIGAVEEGAVRSYYRAALPALGWALESDTAAIVFVRGRERLTLAFARESQEGSDGALAVRYRVIARPASLALD